MAITNMQEKILRAVHERISDAGLDAVFAQQSDNAASIYVQHPAEFETLLRISYRFGDMTVRFETNGKTFTARPFTRSIAYADASALTGYLTDLEVALAPLATPQSPAGQTRPARS